MDHFVKIYKTEAAAYHALIEAEDVDGNLLPALQAITSLAGKRVLDLGSGTGRIPLLLGGLNCKIVSIDLHRAMLVEQHKQLGADADILIQADLRRLPLITAAAEVVIAGWAIGHFTGWYPKTWETEVQLALAEMFRIAEPGGTIIVLETMGTGSEKAKPPNRALAEYYSILKNEHRFTRQVVATDYDFGSVDCAAELGGFFFGIEMAVKIKRNKWKRVPEWTGIWHKKIT